MGLKRYLSPVNGLARNTCERNNDIIIIQKMIKLTVIINTVCYNADRYP